MKPMVNSCADVWCRWALVLLFVLGLAVTPGVAETFTSDTLIGAGNTTYDGDDIIVDGCTLTVNGAHSFASLQVIGGGVVTHSANGSIPMYGIDLTITNDVNVYVGSRIDATGRGYSSSNGPGAGTDWYHASGAGHGGEGGRASSWVIYGGGVYGSIVEPTALGSGGGRDDDDGKLGGAGGGLIRLVVGGTVTLNGEIVANGGNGGGSHAGGGAGGSIWLTVGAMNGNGVISVDGGASSHTGVAGGGGGGRIALYYDDMSSFDGLISAYGGAGYFAGGERALSTRRIQGRHRGSWRSSATQRPIARSPFWTARPRSVNFTQNPTRVSRWSSRLHWSVWKLKDTGTVMFPMVGQSLDVTVDNNVNVRTGALISADGLGYGSSDGPGAGEDRYYAAGGGYGAKGGRSSAGADGGESYGSITEPVDFGSGGGYDDDDGKLGGAGGGAIRLDVGGVLTVNGEIRAHGNGGGGSQAVAVPEGAYG